MSARKRRRRQAAKPAAIAQVRAAAQPLNKSQSSPGKVVAVATTATRLPKSLENRLTGLEARLEAVEQLRICPLACSPSCSFRCPTAGGEQ